MVSGVDEAVGTWEGRGVDVAAIESALTAFWKKAGRSQDGMAPARTSVMNLVVYVAREEETGPVTETIGSLSGRHPSRTIIVVSDPDAPASTLDARVSGQCTQQAEGFASERLCWEEIIITAHGETSAHVPSVVMPLLLPDLPVYLWWTGDPPFDSPLFRRMVDLCDRMIVDSASFADPVRGLCRFAELCRNTDENCGASDFHWVRLAPWRNLAAQFYDKQDLRPYARYIDAVDLRYNAASGQGTPAQALLLAGWLAARLDWSPRAGTAPADHKTLRLHAARDGGSVQISIAPVDMEVAAEAGELVSLLLSATMDGTEARFTIERHADREELTARACIGAAEGMTHTVRMAARRHADVLCEELDIFRHDHIFEQALDACAALCAQITMEEA